MPELTLTTQDRTFLRRVGATDAPLLMAEKDWQQLAAQLMNDLSASEATFQQLSDAYKRLEKESAEAHCAAKRAKRLLFFWRGVSGVLACIVIVALAVAADFVFAGLIR